MVEYLLSCQVGVCMGGGAAPLGANGGFPPNSFNFKAPGLHLGQFGQCGSPF